MKPFITLLFIILNWCALGQTSLKHIVYFATDDAVISEVELEKLRAFFGDFSDEVIQSIDLTGHTDSDGTDEYNLNLSKRRVEAVRKQLIKIDLGTKPTEMFYGEAKPVDANTNELGKQHNRRVEISVTLAPPPPEPIVRVIPPADKNVPEIEGDTMIVYPQGTCMIVSKKDYLENPNCIEIIEFLDGESARAAGQTTMAADGSPLISGGMLDVKMCDDSKCVTVLIPTRTVCGQEIPFTEWSRAESENAWREKTGRPLPVIMLADQGYYKMTICKSGSINCDFRATGNKCRLFVPKTRIKLKNGSQIKSIQIASDEPMMLETPLRLRKRKAVFVRTCPCTDPLLYVEAINKDGEMDTIEFRPLNDFDKREAFGKCKVDEVEKKILFFKVKKKTKYRKYLVRKEDFEN